MLLVVLEVQAFVAVVRVALVLVERSAERDAVAAHLARVGAAAHREDLALFAGHVLIGARKQLHERAVLRQVERRLVGEEQIGEARALDGAAQDRVDVRALLERRVADVDVEAAFAVFGGDKAEVEGQRAARLVGHLHADLRAVPGQADLLIRKAEERAAFRAEDGDEQADQVRGGIDAVFRPRGVRSHAVRRDVRAVRRAREVKPDFAGGCRIGEAAVFRVVAEDVRLRLVRDGVDNRARPEAADPIADRSGHREAEQALFAVAQAVGSVGREAHRRLLLPREVIAHVLHADLLGRAEHDAQLALADDARVAQGAQAVQRDDCRTLVVGHAAAVGKAVADRHGERIAFPALAGRHDVEVRHDDGVFLALADLGVHRVVVAVFRGQIIARAELHRLVDGGRGILAERVRPRLRHRDGGHRDDLLQVAQYIVPVIENLLSKHT